MSHLELLFFTVLAFPNASRTGLDWISGNISFHLDLQYYLIIHEEWNSPTSRTCCSTVLPSVPDRPPMNARYLISIFVVSVLPAPLSPLTKMDWLPCSFIIALIFDTFFIRSIQTAAFRDYKKLTAPNMSCMFCLVVPKNTMIVLLCLGIEFTQCIKHNFLKTSMIWFI